MSKKVNVIFEGLLNNSEAVESIQGCERKRKRIFKTIKNKILLASSNKSK